MCYVGVGILEKDMATAEQKKRQRAKAKKAGGRQVSAQFSEDEIALLDRLKERHPGKSQRELFVAGLRALDQKPETTKADVIAWIERNAE